MDKQRNDIGEGHGGVQLNSEFEILNESSEILLNLNKIDKVNCLTPIYSLNGLYKMYYGSTIEWDYKNSEMLHVINYAESKNGHNFNPKGIAFPYIERYEAFQDNDIN